jgi:hypothetical protein
MKPNAEESSPAYDSGSTDSRWALVQRVAASDQFRRSERLREFLLYVSDRAIHGHADEVTERQVGLHVFGRTLEHNYSEDNIVRSHARLLRLKLESYFSRAGKDEPVVITIPTGAYVPIFQSRQVEAAPAGPDREAVAKRGKWPVLAYVFSSAMVIAALLYVWVAGSGPDSVRAEFVDARPQNLLWSRIFDKDHPTIIVVSDHAFAINQEALGRSLTLEEYLSPAYRSGEMTDPRLESMVHRFASRHYTLLSDVTAVAQIMRRAEMQPERFCIRYARDLTMRELVTGNAILLGGNDVNPWRELYEPQLNFMQSWDYAAHRNYFLNRAPRPGERERYDVQLGSHQYGGLAFVPNLNQSGEVLMIYGTAMAGVEAVMDFLTNPAMSDRFYEKLKGEAGSRQLPHFELLLNTTTVSNASTEIPTEPTIVAYRIIP